MVYAICYACVEDSYLSEIIKEEGKNIKCSVCHESEHEAVTVHQLGKIIEPVMREHFKLGDSVKKFGREDEEWWGQDGDDLSDIVQEVLGQYFDFHDEIVSAVVAADPAWPPSGEEPYWDRTSNYVRTRVQTGHYTELWHDTLDELKHGRRFFSPAARQLFEMLFKEIETLHAHEGSKLFPSAPVAYTLPEGSQIYRARVCDSSSALKQFLRDPMKEVGPPPPQRASAGRMNAEGISVLYAAEDLETCVAEMRPALGREVALIELRTTRALRILNFPRLERSRSLKGLSYFQADFSDEVERHAFLRRLHRYVSQPIVPGHEADYLITQTMAEYLAHVHEPPFDGILFSSVQREGGKNIVLFAKSNVISNVPAEIFNVEYVEGSFKLVRTEAIQYSHRELRIYTDVDNEHSVAHW
jgi:hypothetical protein